MAFQESEIFVNRSESGKAITFHIEPFTVKRMFTLSFETKEKLPPSMEELPVTIQQTPIEPVHYREEPGHFTLRVKLDETSILLLEEEVKYIKGKHALLQKSKKAGDEA